QRSRRAPCRDPTARFESTARDGARGASTARRTRAGMGSGTSCRSALRALHREPTDMHEQAPAPLATAEDLVARLEFFAADHARLAEVPYELRRRILAACGRIADPSCGERRAMRRALRRKDHRDRRARDLQALHHATLRRERSENKVASAPLPLHALPE